MEQRPQSGQAFLVHPSEHAEGYHGVLVSDCTLYVKEIPQGKRYGIVVTEDTREREVLRISADSNGTEIIQYYSGTHAEILQEEENFWKVCIGTEVGYLSKTALREVMVWVE